MRSAIVNARTRFAWANWRMLVKLTKEFSSSVQTWRYSCHSVSSSTGQKKSSSRKPIIDSWVSDLFQNYRSSLWRDTWSLAKDSFFLRHDMSQAYIIIESIIIELTLHLVTFSSQAWQLRNNAKNIDDFKLVSFNFYFVYRWILNEIWNVFRLNSKANGLKW